MERGAEDLPGPGPEGPRPPSQTHRRRHLRLPRPPGRAEEGGAAGGAAPSRNRIPSHEQARLPRRPPRPPGDGVRWGGRDWVGRARARVPGGPGRCARGADPGARPFGPAHRGWDRCRAGSCSWLGPGGDDGSRLPVPGASGPGGGGEGESRHGRHGHRHGSANGRGLCHGHLPLVPPERVRQGQAEHLAQQGGDRCLRARVGEQGDHRGRHRAGALPRTRRAAVGAMEDAGGRLRDPRRAPSWRRGDDGRRHRGAVQQHRRGGGRGATRGGASGHLPVEVRAGPGHRDRVSRRVRRHDVAAVPVVGHQPGHHGLRSGDRGHAPPDDLGVRDDRQRWREGPAPSGPRHRRPRGGVPPGRLIVDTSGCLR